MVNQELLKDELYASPILRELIEQAQELLSDPVVQTMMIHTIWRDQVDQWLRDAGMEK